MWDLKTYVQAEERVCPTLPKWRELWELLPDHDQAGSGCHPTIETIETNWDSTTDEEKQRWLSFHVDYALEHGEEDKVTHFLVDLHPNDWHNRGDIEHSPHPQEGGKSEEDGWTAFSG